MKQNNLCGSGGGNCNPVAPTPTVPVKTLTDLVNNYVAVSRPWRSQWVSAYSLKKSVPVNTSPLPRDLITICTYGLRWDRHRKFFVPMAGHQRRIAGTLPLIVAELKKRNVLAQRFSSFELLFDFVTGVARTVRLAHPNLKFGPLANYDVAYRLATVMGGSAPKNYCYFHAGALEGIKKLYANAKLSLPPKARQGIANYTIRYVDLVSEPLFAALKLLSADEIEDLCCCSKNDLLTVALP